MKPHQPFRIEWAQVALDDLLDIYDYIAEHGPANAGRVIEGIHQRAAALSTSPLRGRMVPELKKQGITLYRELVHDVWRIIYRCHDNIVTVLAVLDGRRNLEDLLLLRLLRET
jgi:plasmid stabilization system protein ParE